MSSHNRSGRLPNRTTRDTTSYKTKTIKTPIQVHEIGIIDDFHQSTNNYSSSTIDRSTSSNSSRTTSSPERTTKEWALANQDDEDSYHAGRGTYYKGLPPLDANLKAAVYGPGAAQW